MDKFAVNKKETFELEDTQDPDSQQLELPLDS